MRALPTEKTLARVCREAKATVRTNVKLRDMNVLGISALHERAIEVLASGLLLQNGAQLAVDITLRTAIRPSATVKNNTHRLNISCPAYFTDKLTW